jgi:hypothetical protein
MLLRNVRETLLDHTMSYLVGQYSFRVTALRSTNPTALVQFVLTKALSWVMSLAVKAMRFI